MSVNESIPKNQIKSRNTIEQREHEDDAAARRVVSVDEGGDFSGTPDNPLIVSDVSSANGKDWDDLLLTRDPVTQDITVATYKKNGNVVRTVTCSYDANENLQEVTKS